MAPLNFNFLLFTDLHHIHSPHSTIISRFGYFNSIPDFSSSYQHHHRSSVKQALSALLIFLSPTTDTTNAWSRTLDAAGVQFNTTMWPKNREEILNVAFLSAVL